MILVTGATGFIGSHMVERLVAAGRPSRCLVRRYSTAGNLPRAAELALGDLETGAGLAEALNGVDTIIHLAGVTKACTAADYHRGNTVATANLLRAAGNLDCIGKFVHVSSLAAAGPSTADRPLTEADEPRPVSDYGRSKLAAEEAVRRSPLRERAVILRPPVVYGPRDRDVYQMIRTATRGWMAQIGAAPRRFSHIYVGDLVDGVLAAADHASAGIGGRFFYMANSAPASWDEFGNLVSRLMGCKVRTVAMPECAAYILGWCAERWTGFSGRPGILSRDKVLEACCAGWVCDSGRARRELGFCASTNLEDGLRRTLDWYKGAGWLKF
ncbi:MAG TPA: NAD-dependent epimerase/dehydratase family protein [Bryobacteraceae bacterium]|nr:NAD-dependent epimerase/dehydratase family protein [Bryobacteraceae bacterium]